MDIALRLGGSLDPREAAAVLQKAKQLVSPPELWCDQLVYPWNVWWRQNVSRCSVYPCVELAITLADQKDRYIEVDSTVRAAVTDAFIDLGMPIDLYISSHERRRDAVLRVLDRATEIADKW